jgi:uncharacterized membrane protein YebE (DUF533 family)
MSNEPETVEESAAPPEARASVFHDEHVLDLVAYKILLTWLRNRYVESFSFTLHLNALTQEQMALLADAMVAAARSDGSFDPGERDHLEAAWKLIDVSESGAALFRTALEAPRALHDILDAANDAQSRALVYTGSLLAIEKRSAVHRFYLRYLAARLGLPKELVSALEQRFAK